MSTRGGYTGWLKPSRCFPYSPPPPDVLSLLKLCSVANILYWKGILMSRIKTFEISGHFLSSHLNNIQRSTLNSEDLKCISTISQAQNSDLKKPGVLLSCNALLAKTHYKKMSACICSVLIFTEWVERALGAFICKSFACSSSTPKWFPGTTYRITLGTTERFAEEKSSGVRCFFQGPWTSAVSDVYLLL